MCIIFRLYSNLDNIYNWTFLFWTNYELYIAQYLLEFCSGHFNSKHQINDNLGPSFAMDGGWICGSNGLAKAKEMIENGTISAAIVGNTNLVLRPEIQLQFEGLGKLNRSDRTKSFSPDGKHSFNNKSTRIIITIKFKEFNILVKK